MDTLSVGKTSRKRLAASLLLLASSVFALGLGTPGQQASANSLAATGVSISKQVPGSWPETCYSFYSYENGYTWRHDYTGYQRPFYGFWDYEHAVKLRIEGQWITDHKEFTYCHK